MYNLERAISDWRKQMLAAGIKTRTALDELENHLREDIARLLTAGNSEAEAFQIAAARVGNPGSVVTEFKKNDIFFTSVKVGLLVWASLSAALLTFLFSKWFGGKLSLLLLAHIFSLTAGYGAAFLAGGVGVYYVCCRWLRASSSAQEQVLSRAVLLFTLLSTCLVLVGFVLGMFWSGQNRGQYLTGDPREIGTASAAVWLVAMLLIRRFRQMGDRAVILFSIVGNMIVGFAWFGAGSIAHGYGVGSFWPLDVLLGVHLLFLVMGIMPLSEVAEA